MSPSSVMLPRSCGTRSSTTGPLASSLFLTAASRTRSFAARRAAHAPPMASTTTANTDTVAALGNRRAVIAVTIARRGAFAPRIDLSSGYGYAVKRSLRLVWFAASRRSGVTPKTSWTVRSIDEW